MSSNRPLVQQLAEGTGIGLVGRFAGRFLSLMGDIIVARILGPAVFGLYSIGLTIFR
jgi:O-antigen/teichoic acid export membrane protein